MHGCGESKVMSDGTRGGACSLPCMVNKPALDTQEMEERLIPLFFRFLV